ncbi:YlxR family protein [Thermodesulfobacteriota bacterium]
MAKGKSHTPSRTCIACGRVTMKADLIRMILNKEGHLIRDDTALMQGRGAYVCKDPVCLEKITQNRYSQRAFRGRKVVSVSSRLHSL